MMVPFYGEGGAAVDFRITMPFHERPAPAVDGMTQLRSECPAPPVMKKRQKRLKPRCERQAFS
jgi:hypothetical protein